MEELFKQLKIKPKNIELYKTAFSHSSYVNEHKVKNDYERLEFLGDAVLDLVVADYLYSNYKETEGDPDIVKEHHATVRKVILSIVVPYIKDPTINFFSDYKSTLQEYVQTEQKSIDYVLVKEEGPAHNKLFTVEVQIEGIVYGQGIGSSKKEAEQEAAKAAISKMAKNV